MMSISSPAGKRLAKARAAVKASQERDIPLIDRYRIHREFEEAAEALADELVAQNFHEMEGD
ncbi:hypothetical protein R6258_07785 [Halomonas sp. HP20-15]|uniref:hypothetical protein n=1 Tax=Halomonas sp. HP20-15 TaxID=3085901 RepID=UPI002982A085|nr:hypothetical protein [Halomonas sp. HP20-15]MDW5376820.1 hypothetical protein [Halomonas sp. HP20-15]